MAVALKHIIFDPCHKQSAEVCKQSEKENYCLPNAFRNYKHEVKYALFQCYSHFILTFYKRNTLYIHIHRKLKRHKLCNNANETFQTRIPLLGFMYAFESKSYDAYFKKFYGNVYLESNKTNYAEQTTLLLKKINTDISKN